MFNNQQIKYMQEQLNLNLDFNNLSDDDWVKIEDIVGTRLQTHGLSKNNSPTKDAIMCDSILSKIPT